MLQAAILYGLVAMFASGLANALLKRAAGGMGVLPTVIFRSGVSALALWAVFIAVRPVIVFSAGMLAFAVAVSILGYFPFLFFIAGLKEGKVGVVAPIAASWIAIAAVTSFVLYSEPFTVGKIVALVLVILGVLFSSVNLKDWQSGFSLQSGVLFAAIAAVMWGIVFPLFKVPSEYFGALFFACLIESMVCLSGFAHRILTRTPVPSIDAFKASWMPVFAAGVLTALFTLSVGAGYLTGEVSVVSALAGSGVVVTLLVARLFEKERLSALQYVGAGPLLLGIILASMMSPL